MTAAGGWAAAARCGARRAHGEEDEEHWILRPGANKRRGRGTAVKMRLLISYYEGRMANE
jgi:hypothetical protein